MVSVVFLEERILQFDDGGIVGVVNVESPFYVFPENNMVVQGKGGEGRGGFEGETRKGDNI